MTADSYPLNWRERAPDSRWRRRRRYGWMCPQPAVANRRLSAYWNQCALLPQTERDQFSALRRAADRDDDVLRPIYTVGHRGSARISRQRNLRHDSAITRIQSQQRGLEHGGFEFVNHRHAIRSCGRYPCGVDVLQGRKLRTGGIRGVESPVAGPCWLGARPDQGRARD